MKKKIILPQVLQWLQLAQHSLVSTDFLDMAKNYKHLWQSLTLTSVTKPPRLFRGSDPATEDICLGTLAADTRKLLYSLKSGATPDLLFLSQLRKSRVAHLKSFVFCLESSNKYLETTLRRDYQTTRANLQALRKGGKLSNIIYIRISLDILFQARCCH